MLCTYMPPSRHTPQPSLSCLSFREPPRDKGVPLAYLHMRAPVVPCVVAGQVAVARRLQGQHRARHRACAKSVRCAQGGAVRQSQESSETQAWRTACLAVCALQASLPRPPNPRTHAQGPPQHTHAHAVPPSCDSARAALGCACGPLLLVKATQPNPTPSRSSPQNITPTTHASSPTPRPHQHLPMLSRTPAP